MSNFIMIPIMTLEFKTIKMITYTTHQLDFLPYYGVETHPHDQLYHGNQPLNGPQLHLDAEYQPHVDHGHLPHNIPHLQSDALTIHP